MARKDIPFLQKRPGRTRALYIANTFQYLYWQCIEGMESDIQGRCVQLLDGIVYILLYAADVFLKVETVSGIEMGICLLTEICTDYKLKFQLKQ